MIFLPHLTLENDIDIFAITPYFELGIRQTGRKGHSLLDLVYWTWWKMRERDRRAKTANFHCSTILEVPI